MSYPCFGLSRDELRLEQIETGWAAQPRRPTAEQVDNWIRAGRK
jgi:hypothetical protein